VIALNITFALVKEEICLPCRGRTFERVKSTKNPLLKETRSECIADINMVAPQTVFQHEYIGDN